MKEKTEIKVRFIVKNWINGNRQDAAKKIASMSKLELANMLTAAWVAEPSILTWDTNKRICFENFIINSLETK